MLSFFQKSLLPKTRNTLQYTQINRKLFSSTISGCHFIKPKLYADVNLSREKEFYDFENMKLKLG
jgi:hypothetical protein